MTSTLNWSAISFLLLLVVSLFRFEAGCFRDLLECLDVGLNHFDELGWSRQVGKRAYAFKTLLDRIFRQHLLHCFVELVDNRLRRASWKHQTVPAKIANATDPAFGECRYVRDRRPACRCGYGEDPHVTGIHLTANGMVELDGEGGV